MASAPSMSISVESVNIGKFLKGEGNGKYDCSVTSCDQKAPRALTGSLASTAHSCRCSPFRRSRRRNCVKVLSSKSGFQRHKQRLQHAKTSSARHKIMKFLKEQAVTSASELMAFSVSEFYADSDEETEVEEVSHYSRGSKHTWERILTNVMKMSSSKVSEDDFQFQNASIKVPKVNGNYSNRMRHVSLKAKGELLSQGNGVAQMILVTIPMYKEVLPGLENWCAYKVASWDKLEGHSVQRFCVVCIDRTGLIAEITTLLADLGITICSCAAEVDRGRGTAVILFQVETSLECLVSACSKVDLILGVLGWSTGCSWPGLMGNQQIREC